MKIEAARNGKNWDEIESDSNQVRLTRLSAPVLKQLLQKHFLTQSSITHQDCDILRTHVSRIQELEGELHRLKNVPNLKRSRLGDCIGSEDGLLRSKIESLNELSSDSVSKVVDIFGKKHEALINYQFQKQFSFFCSCNRTMLLLSGPFCMLSVSCSFIHSGFRHFNALILVDFTQFLYGTLCGNCI